MEKTYIFVIKIKTLSYIDSFFDTTDINYLDQITNNAPDNVKNK
ncbi:hypothetical protein [Arsenophonus endosymbiont of Bemisia tabaci]|nr:hypothetical protein [Arsenophonus endosymbiont of Bemisia tabaci]